jgi:hypothetical protein
MGFFARLLLGTEPSHAAAQEGSFPSNTQVKKTVTVLMSLLVPGNIGGDDEDNCTHMLIEVQPQLHFIIKSLADAVR